MLYAASVLRVLSAAGAGWREQRMHVFVMCAACVLESGTYLYMLWQFDYPTSAWLWLIGAGRALAAPLFATYLSMAHPLPVTPRDMAYQAALASGKGVIRDVTVLSHDPTAPLAQKVRVYQASSTMSAADGARFDNIIAAVSHPDATAATRSSMEPPARSAALPPVQVSGPEQGPPACGRRRDGS